MERRGQVTLFIVIGLVLFTVIAVGVYFRSEILGTSLSSELAEREALTEEQQQVAKQVDACVENTLAKGIVKVSADGGYYPALEESLRYQRFKVPYYLEGKKETIPTLETLRGSLTRYVTDNLKNCLIPLDLQTLESLKADLTLDNEVSAEVTTLLKVGDASLKQFRGEVNFDYTSFFNDVMGLYHLMKELNTSLQPLALHKGLTLSASTFTYDRLNTTFVYVMNATPFYEENSLAFSFAIKGVEEVETLDELETFITSIPTFDPTIEVEGENVATELTLSDEEWNALEDEPPVEVVALPYPSEVSDDANVLGGEFLD